MQYSVAIVLLPKNKSPAKINCVERDGYNRQTHPCIKAPYQVLTFMRSSSGSHNSIASRDNRPEQGPKGRSIPAIELT
jgi:hypothetical protein